MFKQDKFIIGVLLGLIGPALAFISVEILKFDVKIFGKDHLLYIVAAVINLIMLRMFFKYDKQSTATGISFSTFVCGIALIILLR